MRLEDSEEMSQIQMLEEGLYSEQNELDHKILKTYKISKSVKWFSLIDSLFNLFFVFFSPWYLIPSLISIIGYIGASKKIVGFLYVYLTYQISMIVLRLSLGINYWFENDFSVLKLTINIILTIILTFFDSYISRFTHLLIKSIKSLDVLELQKLRNIREFKTKFIFW